MEFMLFCDELKFVYLIFGYKFAKLIKKIILNLNP